MAYLISVMELRLISPTAGMRSQALIKSAHVLCTQATLTSHLRWPL